MEGKSECIEIQVLHDMEKKGETELTLEELIKLNKESLSKKKEDIPKASLNLIRIHIIGKEFKALVDCGAQNCFATEETIIKSGLSSVIDWRNQGVVGGVGQTSTVGVLPRVQFQIGQKFYSMSVVILKKFHTEFLLGLDFLMKYEIIPDYINRKMYISATDSTEIFLADADIPQCMRGNMESISTETTATSNNKRLLDKDVEDSEEPKPKTTCNFIIDIEENKETRGKKKKPDRNPESNLRLPNDLIFELSSEGHLLSVVPGLVNIRGDISIQEMICNFTFGYNDEAKVPVTCVETGLTRLVELVPGLTVLVDRPLSPASWVKQQDRIGWILGIRSLVDLEINDTGFVIKDVKEGDVKVLPEFYQGQYIFYDTWIGCVKSVQHCLQIVFEKGHECFIYTDEENQLHRKLHLKYPGDRISLTGSDVEKAEWVKHPGKIEWFLMRYLNTGYRKSLEGEVTKNFTCGIKVSWLQKSLPNTKRGVEGGDIEQPVPPSDELSEKLLSKVQKLVLPGKNYLWYGTKGKYIVKESDKIIGLQTEWRDSLIEEFDLTKVVPRLAGGDAPNKKVNSEQPLETTKFPPGIQITGVVIMRRAVATVIWYNGEVSDHSVKDLVPYYPQANQPPPLCPGTIVKRSESPEFFEVNIEHKYGVVQYPINGVANVKWLESQEKIPDNISPDTYESFRFTKMCRAKELLEFLEKRPEFNYPIGIIVVDRMTGAPGIVAGNDMNGNVLVKRGHIVEKTSPYCLDKLKSIAFTGLGDKIHWQKHREHKLINQKHMTAIPWSTNFGNVIPPMSAIIVSTSEDFASHISFPSRTPEDHKFILTPKVEFSQPKNFLEEWQIGMEDLGKSILDGIWVHNYKDRSDLFSIVVEGKSKTPFEFGLYSFDIIIPPNYPNSSPAIRYKPFGGPHDIDLGFDEGVIVFDELLKEKGIEVKGGTYLYNLINIVNVLKDTLFVVALENVHEYETDDASGLSLPFASYTDEFRTAMKNQEILKNVLEMVTFLISAPPPAWEDAVWEYYKLQVPRLISRVKKWVFLLDTDTFNEAELELSDAETPGYSLFPLDPTIQDGISQALMNLAAAYSKVY